MPSLLLNLDGPLQSWGSSSRFTVRSTENSPTKSGVIGLLAAAQARSRDDDISDLVGLHFGVRIDAPGTILRDFQTEIDWRTGKSKPLTQRYYLQDAKFVAAIEGDRALLESLQIALKAPKFPLFLGRRACPPARPIAGRIVTDDLITALQEAPWIAAAGDRRRDRNEVHLPYSRDILPGERPDEMIRDTPVSFAMSGRKYDLRGIVHGFVTLKNPNEHPGPDSTDEHDPMALLGGA